MEDRIRAPERSRNSAVTFAREMKRKPLKKRQGIRISRSHVKWKESLQKRGREFGSHVKREQKESLQKRQGIGSHVWREKDQGLDPDTLRLLDSTSFSKIDSCVCLFVRTKSMVRYLAHHQSCFAAAIKIKPFCFVVSFLYITTHEPLAQTEWMRPSYTNKYHSCSPEMQVVKVRIQR